MIPADDSVRLLDAVFERIDYTKLYAAYSRMGRIETSPKNLFKVVVYGGMSGAYSSRQIEESCRRDINFMYLLGREPAPDHATIARFRSERLPGVIDDLFDQLVQLLAESGELSLESVFIDGTKLEANANRYSFVWKKTTLKNEAKMQEKMKTELPNLAASFGLRFHVGEKIPAKDLKKLRKRLKSLQREQGLEFVHGKGQRKTPLQQAIEKVEEYLSRQKQYDDYNHSFGERNSFSKTDRDATFMRMKEDHMKKRPAEARVQRDCGGGFGVHRRCNAFIGAGDSLTLIPMLEKLKWLGYAKPVADAGFESEENYAYCEENGQLAFIKPSNHDRLKTKKYRTDISKRENMPYDAESDGYICYAGHRIEAAYEKKTKSKSGYSIVTTVYACTECSGCPHKDKCIKKGNSKVPMDERSKTFMSQRTSCGSAKRWRPASQAMKVCFSA